MKTTRTIAKATSVLTLPRIVVLIAIVCLLFQIQRGKSNEAPKYTAPKFMKTSLLERINEHRVSLKLKPLALDSSLNKEAQRYCEMAAKGNLQASLESSLASGVHLANVADWDNARGLHRSMATFESNSASPALDVVRTWIGNANDVSNLEDAGAATTGIGIVRKGDTYYVCQMFGK
jgi:uncharacterized protein YkwD